MNRDKVLQFLCGSIIFAFIISPLNYRTSFATEIQRREKELRDIKTNPLGMPFDEKEKTLESLVLPPKVMLPPSSFYLSEPALVKSIKLVGNHEEIKLFKSLTVPNLPVGPKLIRKLREDCEGQILSEESIREIARVTTRFLIENQFYLGFIVPTNTVDAEGILTFKISLGRVGNVTISKSQEQPLQFYSRKQIGNRFPILSGHVFDYAVLHDAVSELNAIQDLTLDIYVKAFSDPQSESRFADLNLTYKSKLPLHFSLNSGNHGTDSTGEERFETSLSYGNITGHFDTVNLAYSLSNDRDEFESISGYYELPFLRKNHVRIFGGQSDTAIQDIVDPLFEITGEEDFLGFQISHHWKEDQYSFLHFSLGRVWRKRKDRIFFDNQLISDMTPRVAPFDFGIHWGNYQQDPLGGFVRFTLQTVINRDSIDGTSSPKEFASDTDRDYEIFRAYAVRRQILPISVMNLTISLEAQYSNENLTSSEQISAGGSFSVRGYEEDELLRDKGIIGNVELGSSDFSFDFATKWFSNEETGPIPVTLSGFGFIDFANLKLNQSQTLSTRNSIESIYSIGLGIRLNIFTNFSFHFDYGWPLRSTGLSNPSGRGHWQISLTY